MNQGAAWEFGVSFFFFNCSLGDPDPDPDLETIALNSASQSCSHPPALIMILSVWFTGNSGHNCSRTEVMGLDLASTDPTQV